MKKILNFIKRIRNAAKCAVQGYRHGGSVKAFISEINYGNLFSERDVVLVSGGSKGIGLAIAEKLLKEGATVIITGRNKAKLEEVSSSLESDRIYEVDLDISDSNQFEKKIDEMEKIIGSQISALVNNAGVYADTYFPNITEKDAMKVFTTNATGTLLLSQCLCKRWIANASEKPRKIINISSQGGFVGANNAYRMTKWGIRGLTAYMGKNLAKFNIIVNGVAPGIVLTDMQPKFQKQGDNLATELTPIGRIAIPIEIAELVAFILSDAANNIVGQTICCDGGYSLK